jgi:hypothetical protein
VDNYFFVSVEDYNNNFSSNLIISENENSYLGSSICENPIMVSSTEILTVNLQITRQINVNILVQCP